MKDSKDVVSFGAFLRSYRKLIGYGLRQFAREIGISPASLSAMELGVRGVPKTFDWLKCADLLGIKQGSKDWDVFLGFRDECKCGCWSLATRVANLEIQVDQLRSSVLKASR